MSVGTLQWDFANIVGMVGSAMMVVAYGYSNVVKTMNFVLFNLLNLVGSLLLIWSLTVHFNLASMTLEIVWTIIALLGLIKALKRKAS
jgi:hypothetical protein